MRALILFLSSPDPKSVSVDLFRCLNFSRFFAIRMGVDTAVASDDGLKERSLCPPLLPGNRLVSNFGRDQLISLLTSKLPSALDTLFLV